MTEPAGEPVIEPAIDDAIAASSPRSPTAQPAAARRSGAFLVAAGIFISRLLGLVRTRFLAGVLGRSIAADAFTVAFRIPNLLANLFGEGSLSASFIPVYARLVRDGDEEESGRTAGAVAASLALVSAIIVLLGVVFAPQITTVIASGLNAPDKAETKRLTIELTRILFPGAGLLVMSAWCLGILNSHRKFFLSYIAPVIWNLAMITALVAFRQSTAARVAVIVAWASVIGNLLMFLVQLPVVLSLVRRVRVSLDWKRPSVRSILGNFLPAFIGRGVAQISGFIDLAIASHLPETLLGLIGYAQNLYMLPVSLFGMSVSASELAEMSHVDETQGVDAHAAMLRRRLDAGLRQIAFLVVPSAVAFLTLGGVMIALLFQNRRFDAGATTITWSIVAGSAVGLLANTMGRLYSSTFYVLRDTRTPLKFALVRITLGAALGWTAAVYVPRWLGIDPIWGGAGLTTAAGVSAWIEFSLLRHALNIRIGRTGIPARFLAGLWAAALLSAALGWGAKLALAGAGPIVAGIIILGVFGATYFGITAAFGIPESRRMMKRLQRTG
jgi:putative peptidoglycan lipid II flippase